jgi:SAM-dependent methyltransferase
MPYYDFWRDKNVTGIGKRWAAQAAVYTIQQLERHVRPLGRVVEIGPGRGPFTRACQERGLQYTAVDANAGLLQALTESDGVCSFVPPLPLRNGVADAVVANHVLEHSSGLPQAEAFLGEMRRIARPGGCVALTTPDLLWYGQYFWDCDYSHNFPTSARRLHQLFLDQRLEVAYIGYIHNHLTGLPGYLAGRAARLVPYRLPGAMPGAPGYSDQIYKARLTFARCVLVIGRRPAEEPL